MSSLTQLGRLNQGKATPGDDSSDDAEHLAKKDNQLSPGQPVDKQQPDLAQFLGTDLKPTLTQ